MQILACIAIVTITGAALPNPVLAQERVSSSYHLSGKDVKRRPSVPNFLDRQFVLLHGERTAHGCSYPSPRWGKLTDERIVETDDANCLQIRSLGFFLGPPTPGPNMHVMISSFDFKTDTSHARADSARRDTVRRKP